MTIHDFGECLIAHLVLGIGAGARRFVVWGSYLLSTSPLAKKDNRVELSKMVEQAVDAEIEKMVCPS